MPITPEIVHRSRHLAVVPNDDHAVRRAEVDVSPEPLVTSTRCRPSELPDVLSVRLDAATMRRADEMARAAGVAVETWLRFAVECSRQADRAADVLSVDRTWVEREVDRTSDESVSLQPTGAAPLAAYLRSLGTNAADDRRDEASPVLVPLPDELVVAWTTAATTARMSTDAWVASHIMRAPADPVSWEAAAARRGCYLGEWVLLAAASASSSARRKSAPPQA